MKIAIIVVLGVVLGTALGGPTLDTRCYCPEEGEPCKEWNENNCYINWNSEIYQWQECDCCDRCIVTVNSDWCGAFTSQWGFVFVCNETAGLWCNSDNKCEKS